MKTITLLFPTLSLLLLSATAHAGGEVDRLLAEYAKIDTVTCQIRRTKDGAAGKMRFLSRVYWTSKGELHAEGIAPLKRRTIADGKTLWQYVEGDPKGFSRPINALSEPMTISLKMVPGTAMDQLLRLAGREEVAVAGKEGSGKCIGIQADGQYITLQFDDLGRLIAIDFFSSADMQEQTAGYRYGDFSEVLPGVWVPTTHEVELHKDGIDFSETVKVDRFIANQPIAQSLFNPTSFFDNTIDFVDDFAKIFPE